ncbi:unnamed protein product [Closterium sp. Naga37s-1]|nr:unnamed protein product [Closterium sp. Naga37s-1]
MQLEWPHIEVVPCATHVLDLLEEDIGKTEWAHIVVDRANAMITFLRIHQWTRAFLRSPQLHGTKLMQMVVHDDWKARGKKATAEQFEGWVIDEVWWKKVAFFVEVMELPVARKTDLVAKGMILVIYDIMLQLMEELTTLLEGEECCRSEEDKEEVQDHLKTRLDSSMACPLNGYKLEEDREVEVDEDDVRVDEYEQEGEHGDESEMV